jgi:hypothetical protein
MVLSPSIITLGNRHTKALLMNQNFSSVFPVR